MGETIFDGNWYLLVFGLEPETSPTHFASGLSMQRLEAPLSVFDLAAAGAVGFRAWAVLEPFVHGCRSEIESARDAAVSPGYDTLNRAWLLSAMLKLRGFANHLCLACSSYRWNVIAGHQKRTSHVFQEQLSEQGVEAAVFASKRELPPFRGNLLDFHLNLLLEADYRAGPVTEADAQWVREHFELFNNLAAESDRYRFALEASIDWRYTKDPRVAIARVWSGIEALFSVRSELVYRISLMAASLLAPRGYARKQMFEEVKKLYDRRSKAVHGDKLRDEELLQAMSQSYNLLRELLLLQINRGRVLSDQDFDDAVFG